MADTLNARLAALHAERERTWDTAKLKLNVDQRRELVAAFDPAKTAQVGDVVPPFELLDTAGGILTRDGLIADGPAVLVFFRFAGCPACNVALPYYQQTLWPDLRARGIPLVAVSPQVPDRLRAIKDSHGLTLTVASDPGNTLARQLGITYEANAATRAASNGPDWIGAVTGTDTWELPQPTVLIIDTAGEICFIDVSPDWLKRTEATPALDCIDGPRAVAARYESDSKGNGTTPFGGYGLSGFGSREKSLLSFNQYCENKTVRIARPS